jgi:hypothetical protein
MGVAQPKSTVVALFLVVCCFALAGCSGKSSKLGTVAGDVTLDGQPLKSGIIHFVSADGKAATTDAVITNGKYTVEMPPGDKRISISAPKVVGKRKVYDTPDSPTLDQVQELLPARYNAQSDLRLTVAIGSQQKDYELKSGN